MIESYDSVCDPPGSTYEKIETWTFLHHVVELWLLFDIMFKLASATSTLGRKGGTSLSLGEARIPDSLLVSVDTQLEGNSLLPLARPGNLGSPPGLHRQCYRGTEVIFFPLGDAEKP